MSAFASFALPLLRRLPPERAHELTIRGLAAGAAPRQVAPDDPILAVRLWDLVFPNPVGLAAGFDKNAEVPDAMLRWGRDGGWRRCPAGRLPVRRGIRSRCCRWR